MRRTIRAAVVTVMTAAALSVGANAAHAAPDPLAAVPLPSRTLDAGSSATGTDGDGSLSADGSAVAFTSSTSTAVQTVVMDRRTGVRKGAFPGRSAGISQDGTKVVTWTSCGSTATPPCGIRLVDVATGAATRIDLDANGLPPAAEPSITEVRFDGVRSVAFISQDVNLVSPPAAAGANLFVRDLVTGRTVQIRDDHLPAVAPAGAEISPGGRYVAFTGGGATGATQWLNVFDRVTGRHTQVYSAAATAYGLTRTNLALSTGGKVLFVTDSALTPDDTNGLADAYVYDMATGLTTRVSSGAAGGAHRMTLDNGSVSAVQISADGRYAAYGRAVPGSPFTVQDTVVQSLDGGPTHVITGLDGTTPGHGDAVTALSANGRFAIKNNGTPAGSAPGSEVVQDQAQDCLGDFATKTGAGMIYGSPTGDDVIYGSAGADTIYGYGGDDVVCGLGGDDTIEGGDGDDALYGGTGNDRIIGGAGNDVVDGGAGTDVMNGGPGLDAVLYRSATAGVTVDLTRAAPDGMPGENDTVNNDVEAIGGSAHDDVLTGSAGANVLIGGAGADTLTGLGGDDVLFGGTGSDRLYGNDGDDQLSGGTDPGSATDSSSDYCDGGAGTNYPPYAGNYGCETAVNVS